MYDSEYYDDMSKKYLEVLLRQVGVPEKQIEQVIQLVQPKSQLDHRVVTPEDEPVRYPNGTIR